MKHPSSRAFFAYWDDKRGNNRAPDRSDIKPGAISGLLGDIFVLSYDSHPDFPIRVAGARLCARQGRDLKGESFPGLFESGSRAEIAEILTVVAEELLVVVAGVTAITEAGDTAPLELLLLPFSARAHEPMSLAAMLIPFGDAPALRGPLRLTSFRYLAHPVEPLRPRAVRQWQAARGLMVYEGLT